MYEVTISRDFSAAHRVEDYPGNCERLHGHNWKVEVTAQSQFLDSMGMVVDFRRLKEATDRVLSDLDHTFLNESPSLSGANPTAENIARHIFDAISREIPLHRVRVYETETSFATYTRDLGCDSAVRTPQRGTRPQPKNKDLTSQGAEGAQRTAEKNGSSSKARHSSSHSEVDSKPPGRRYLESAVRSKKG